MTDQRRFLAFDTSSAGDVVTIWRDESSADVYLDLEVKTGRNRAGFDPRAPLEWRIDNEAAHAASRDDRQFPLKVEYDLARILLYDSRRPLSPGTPLFELLHAKSRVLIRYRDIDAREVLLTFGIEGLVDAVNKVREGF